jgi:hypothetical protein
MSVTAPVVCQSPSSEQRSAVRRCVRRPFFTREQPLPVRRVVGPLRVDYGSRPRDAGCEDRRAGRTSVRPGAAGRGVYPICMAEVSSAPAQWPDSGEQIDSGIASRRPTTVVRPCALVDIQTPAPPRHRTLVVRGMWPFLQQIAGKAGRALSPRDSAGSPDGKKARPPGRAQILPGVARRKSRRRKYQRTLAPHSLRHDRRFV